jgi:4-amino-4-deoxy-L-arabinose transferase-like glycosyltransferase
MRRHLPFLLVLIGTAILRVILLFVSQTHVTSDEAIEGLMAKHILEGRYFPFYFYGISYNASCAWEAYLAVIPFALAGVSVIALKIPIVLLSLATVALVYVLAVRLYSIRVANWAVLVFSLWPGLLKWHFQPRGYAFYFLFIPLLLILFLVVETSENRRTRNFFWFGLACGIAFWGMELLLMTILALWGLLLLRRRLSFKTFGVALTGFVIGYAPALWWNLTHEMRNWHFVFAEKPDTGGLAARFGFQAWREIFLHEMPKFFSDDTVLWYFPETKPLGYVLYAVTALGLIFAVRRGLPRIGAALKSGFATSDGTRDLLMLILIAVSFVAYLIAPLRVPGYFLGAVFFMAILLARAIDELFASREMVRRIAATGIVAAVLICGVGAIIDVAEHNEIETLTLSANRQDHEMMRVPGADIDAVKRDLEQNGIGAVWTTFSFVYPFLFETNEKLVVSESIFGIDRPVYPPSIPKPEPSTQERAVFVIESKSPYREQIESTLRLKSDAIPVVREHGTLAVIEQRFGPQPQQ